MTKTATLLVAIFILSGIFFSCSAPPLYILCDEPSEETMTTLADFLMAHDFNIISHTQKSFLAAIAETKPRAVIVYVHKPFLKETEEALFEYCDNGGRLIVLHHAIASAKVENPEWLDYTGVRLSPDHALYPWTVRRGGELFMVKLNSEHFVVNNGVRYDEHVAYRSSDAPSGAILAEAFSLGATELLMNQMFIDGRRKAVLLGYKYVDAENGDAFMADRAGWYLHKGKGLLFYYVAGHQASDFENESFCRIILNSIVWAGPGCAKEEIPAGVLFHPWSQPAVCCLLKPKGG